MEEVILGPLLSSAGDSNVTPLGADLNFPLPNESGPACLVHFYDQESKFKVNDMVEFIGVLSVDPGLAMFADQNMEDAPDSMAPAPDDLITQKSKLSTILHYHLSRDSIA